jgi:hypothetical protein
MEPREIWERRRGDDLRWSRLAEIIGWAAWRICVSIPFAKTDGYFMSWLKQAPPPYFVPPNKRDE